MSEDDLNQSRPIAFASQVILVLSVGLVLLLGLIMVATRAGALSIPLGFEWLTLKVAPIIAAGLTVLSVVALLSSILKKLPVKRIALALGALVINLGLLGGYYAYVQTAESYPPVAEVATNWDTPVTFSDKLMTARGTASKPVQDAPGLIDSDDPRWNGRSLADINAESCPGAEGVLSVNVDEDEVAEILKRNDIQVFSRLPWRVEGVYQDDLYGFRYDIVVRIDPTRIDVRAVSRQNFPDLGTTCRMVTRIVADIKKAA